MECRDTIFKSSGCMIAERNPIGEFDSDREGRSQQAKRMEDRETIPVLRNDIPVQPFPIFSTDQTIGRLDDFVQTFDLSVHVDIPAIFLE
jgi:hypothetical protein